MSQVTFSPPYAHLGGLAQQLQSAGHAVVRPQDVAAWAGVELAGLQALGAGWGDLPPDEFLKDGGRYRRRRHASFVAEPGAVGEPFALHAVPHRAHWQPLEYNALHGGMERWFAPMEEVVLAAPAGSG